MRIALVKTSRELKTEPSVGPPLGLMYLSSVLKAGGHEVSIFDARLYGKNWAGIADEVSAQEPDIIGFGSLTLEADRLRALARAVRERNRKAVILSGGPHPTADPEGVLRDGCIDYVVRGEGENTLVRLCAGLEGREDVRLVPGIAFRENGTVYNTEPAQFIRNIDSLPYPDWDAVGLRRYWRMPRFTGTSGKYITILTSRGCPYQCIYCHSVLGKTFRARSPEKVIEEIEEIIDRYKVSDFEIIDDIFNFDVERAKQICTRIIEKKLRIKISFPNGLRLDRLDFELMQLLKKAGAYYMAVPIETASPRLQSVSGKRLDLVKAAEVMEWARTLGIFTRGYFMVGFPTETDAEMRATVRFARESPLPAASFFKVTPYPGTRLCNDLGSGSNGGRSAADEAALYRMQSEASKEFYSLGRIFRFILAFPSKRSLLRGFSVHVHHLLWKRIRQKKLMAFR